jgi:hypothetical protein
LIVDKVIAAPNVAVTVVPVMGTPVLPLAGVTGEHGAGEQLTVAGGGAAVVNDQV